MSRGAASEAERDQLCKALRDRWLARKSGLLSLLDENWLKKASKELKPVVGRQFNELRRGGSALETQTLLSAVPVEHVASTGNARRRLAQCD